MHTDTVAEPGGHPVYLRLLEEMRELHVRKAADYGRGTDPLANVRASVEFGVPNWVGAMIRANDKVQRIKSFLANGTLKNESVEDSLKDLAAYALIALVLFREGQPEPIDLATPGYAALPLETADPRIGADGHWRPDEGVAEVRCDWCDKRLACRMVKTPCRPTQWECGPCFVCRSLGQWPESIAV